MVDHCPARAEAGPHHFVEYTPPKPSGSMWSEYRTPVAVYCRWCGAWSPLRENPPKPQDPTHPDNQPAAPLKTEQVWSDGKTR